MEAPTDPKSMSWSSATIADAILESYVLPYGPLLLLSFADSNDLGTDSTGETSFPPSSWSMGGWSWCKVRTATAVTILKKTREIVCQMFRVWGNCKVWPVQNFKLVFTYLYFWWVISWIKTLSAWFSDSYIRDHLSCAVPAIRASSRNNCSWSRNMHYLTAISAYTFDQRNAVP